MKKPAKPVVVDRERLSEAIDEAIVFLELVHDRLENLESGREGGLEACSIFFEEKRSELLGTTLSFAYMNESVDNIGEGIDSIECIDIDVLAYLVLIDMAQIGLIIPLIKSRGKAGVMDGALNPASISLIMEKFKSDDVEEKEG